jgi:hypothetical protein
MWNHNARNLAKFRVQNRGKEDILESRLSVGGEAQPMSDRMIYMERTAFAERLPPFRRWRDDDRAKIVELLLIKGMAVQGGDRQYKTRKREM